MNDKIILSGIEIYGHHGCSIEEQTRGQIILVDLEISLNLSGLGDNLENSVDYSQILFDVEKIVAGESRKLIETVAEEIADKLLNTYEKISALKVTVHKPFANLPIKYSDVAVEIFRSRE